MIQRSLIFDVLVDPIVRTALVISLFLLFSGHNSPGGGFVAGLVFGISLILKYVAGGIDEMRAIMPVSAETMLALGLSIAVLAGVGGWAWGDGFLKMEFFEVQLPLLGDVKATTALPFDIGVFGVVVGMVAALVPAFGLEEETEL